MDHLHKYGKTLTEFNYNNKEIADEIYAAMNSTRFLGISVRQPNVNSIRMLQCFFVVFFSGGGRVQLRGRQDSSDADRTAH